MQSPIYYKIRIRRILSINSAQSAQRGSTFIELIVVIVLTALVFTPVYMATLHTVLAEPEKEPLEKIRTALAEHVRVYGHLPCPAQPEIGKSNSDYSKGDCSAVTTSPGEAGGNVHIGAIPVENLRHALGCSETGDDPIVDEILQRHLFDISTLMDAGFSVAPGERETALVELRCINQQAMLNEHGNKFIYAVSDQATDLATFQEVGAQQIRIINKNNNNATKHMQKFVIVDTGADQGGSHMTSVELASACNSADHDGEHCDNDAVFRNMQLYSGQKKYDDRIYFSLDGYRRENSVWEWRDGASGNRSILMNSNARMLIGNSETKGTANDRLTVSGGDMKVNEGNFVINREGVIKSKEVQLQDDSGTLESESKFEAKKFCYTDDMFGSGVGCK